MKTNLCLLATILVLTAFAASCALPLTEEAADPGSRDIVSPLQITVTTDAPTYRVGQTVTMTVTATNTSSAPVKLEFPSTYMYDFVVTFYRSTIWRWSTGKAFLQVLCGATLQPGQSVSFSVSSWRALGSPGVYDLTGILPSKPTAYSGQTQFRIVR